jgi:hypothetical protein
MFDATRPGVEALDRKPARLTKGAGYTVYELREATCLAT